jgi:phage-related protein
MTTANTVISNFGTSARNTISETMNNIVSRTSGAMTNIKNSIQNGFNATLASATSAMSSFRSSIETAWNNVRSATSNAIDSFRSDVNSGFTGALNSLKSTTSSIWGSITSTISGAIDTIKKAVSNTVLKFGSVVIPTFSWSGKNDSTKGTTASMNVGSKTVNYASAMMGGVILDNPTIFGMMNNSMLRAGEAGSEVVVGTNSLMSMIRQNMNNTALVAEVGAIKAILANYIPAIADSDVVLDTGKLVGALTPSINRSLGLKMR